MKEILSLQFIKDYSYVVIYKKIIQRFPKLFKLFLQLEGAILIACFVLSSLGSLIFNFLGYGESYLHTFTGLTLSLIIISDFIIIILALILVSKWTYDYMTIYYKNKGIMYVHISQRNFTEEKKSHLVNNYILLDRSCPFFVVFQVFMQSDARPSDADLWTKFSYFKYYDDFSYKRFNNIIDFLAEYHQTFITNQRISSLTASCLVYLLYEYKVSAKDLYYVVGKFPLLKKQIMGMPQWKDPAGMLLDEFNSLKDQDEN